jgi:hypothetical protein
VLASASSWVRGSKVQKMTPEIWVVITSPRSIMASGERPTASQRAFEGKRECCVSSPSTSSGGRALEEKSSASTSLSPLRAVRVGASRPGIEGRRCQSNVDQEATVRAALDTLLIAVSCAACSLFPSPPEPKRRRGRPATADRSPPGTDPTPTAAVPPIPRRLGRAQGAADRIAAVARASFGELVSASFNIDPSGRLKAPACRRWRRRPEG